MPTEPLKHKLGNGKTAKFTRRRISKDDWRESDGNGNIGISSKIKIGTRRELEIYLHELIHEECPYMKESDVKRLAQSQAMLLWKLGWRIVARKAKRK